MDAPWLPKGFTYPGWEPVVALIYEGEDWQVYELDGGSRLLAVLDRLHAAWVAEHLIEADHMTRAGCAGLSVWLFRSSASHELVPVREARAPATKSEALSFASAFRETRALLPGLPLGSTLYVEALTRLLPVSGDDLVADDTLLGRYFAGGLALSAACLTERAGSIRWGSRSDLVDAIHAAGLAVLEQAEPRGGLNGHVSSPARSGSAFRLPGRPQLEAFFIEHVLDVVEHAERYRKMGIGFPGSVVLHGPPGSGKSYAVSELIDFLGWPRFDIDASSVGSPFIHETSRKVAEVFQKAADAAPAAVVIDEMEAFLSDRGSVGNAQHRVEEVAEFLRRIQDASSNQILVIGLTNKLEMIDPAILRRGRFDHVIHVPLASASEIYQALSALLESIPREADLDLTAIAERLAGRPLSDAAFVIREAARLAARGGKDRVSSIELEQASRSDALQQLEDQRGPIGFDITGRISNG